MIPPSTARGAAFRVFEWAFALALGSTLTWWIGEDPRRVSGAAVDAPEEQQQSTSSTAPAPARAKRVIERGAPEACDTPHPDFVAARETARAESRQRSRDVMANLEARANEVALMSPDPSPEGIANRMTEYIVGMADALEEASPEMAEAMSEQFEQKVCGDGETKPSATRQMLQMRLLRRLPAFATTKTFDCFFNGQGEEDAVLWEGMDALAATDFEHPEALARLRANAVKPQTKMRFMSGDEFAAHVQSDHAAALKAGKVPPSGTDPLALQPVD